MYDEYKFYRRMDLEDLALREEALARSRGGHHEALARMIRAAAARAPRQQLALFPNSSKPKETV